MKNIFIVIIGLFIFFGIAMPYLFKTTPPPVNQKNSVAPQKKTTEAEKKQIAREAKFGEMPYTTRVVRKYLQSVAKDPDSIKIEQCTDAYYSPDGWIMYCDWRGKNSLGGYARSVNWFVIINRNVVAMKSATAYAVK